MTRSTPTQHGSSEVRTGSHASACGSGKKSRPTSFTKLLLNNKEHIADIVVLLCLLAIFLVLEQTGEPSTPFIPADMLYRYSYPKHDHIIPVFVPPLLAFLFPILCFCCHNYLSRRPAIELYRVMVSLLLAVLLTGAIADSMKTGLGRPRPNFVASCWPTGDPVWEDVNAYGGYPNCAVASDVYGDHLKSFPSGQASTSASGLGFLTFWLFGQTRAFGGGIHMWRFMFSLIPTLAAVTIGLSGIVDYWQHPVDVIAGLLLGFGIAFAVYRRLYPAFVHPACSTQLQDMRQAALPAAAATAAARRASTCTAASGEAAAAQRGAQTDPHKSRSPVTSGGARGPVVAAPTSSGVVTSGGVRGSAVGVPTSGGVVTAPSRFRPDSAPAGGTGGGGTGSGGQQPLVAEASISLEVKDDATSCSGCWKVFNGKASMQNGHGTHP